jgi:hypothetical protein
MVSKIQVRKGTVPDLMVIKKKGLSQVSWSIKYRLKKGLSQISWSMKYRLRKGLSQVSWSIKYRLTKGTVPGFMVNKIQVKKRDCPRSHGQ